MISPTTISLTTGRATVARGDRSYRTPAQRRSGRFINSIVVVIAAALLALAPRASGIPSLTPHPHMNPRPGFGGAGGVLGITDGDTTWLRVPERVPDPDPDTPNNSLHQHRDRDPLIGGNGKYIAYSAWDNNLYRLGGEFGHGFQAKPARYLFEPGFLLGGQRDFDNAVNEWERLVNGRETNANGVPIQIQIGFERVNSGEYEIDVKWEEIPDTEDAIAYWNTSTTDFVFDPTPSWIYEAEMEGFDQIALSMEGPWTNSVLVESAWFFGGEGDPGHLPLPKDLYYRDSSSPEMIVHRVLDIARFDFYTIALHELGHAWGLDHHDGGIMRADIAGLVMRDPDAGSIDGLKDLYAIPSVPEPSSAAMLILGAAALIVCRRA